MTTEKEYKIGEFTLKSVGGKVIIRGDNYETMPTNELYNSEVTKRLIIALVERIERLERMIDHIMPDRSNDI